MTHDQMQFSILSPSHMTTAYNWKGRYKEIVLSKNYSFFLLEAHVKVERDKKKEKRLQIVTFLLMIWKNFWKQFNLSNVCCRHWAQFSFHSTFSVTRRFSSKERNYSGSGSIIWIGYDQIMAKKKHREIIWSWYGEEQLVQNNEWPQRMRAKNYEQISLQMRARANTYGPNVQEQFMLFVFTD